MFIYQPFKNASWLESAVLTALLVEQWFDQPFEKSGVNVP